jgi:RimJ/RimL family protein N-acetyltransferase
MEIEIRELTEPTPEIAHYFEKWENDPGLVHLIRPNQDVAAILTRRPVTVKNLEDRLQTHRFYLIYLQGQLIGEMDYQVDPGHLYRKESGTAWVGIVIGEEAGRGRGVGSLAMQYLEGEIRAQGLKRIELGVFEFNPNAIKLYQKLGYQEFARIPNFTYWDGRLWQDIRMEKYL